MSKNEEPHKGARKIPDYLARISNEAPEEFSASQKAAYNEFGKRAFLQHMALFGPKEQVVLAIGQVHPFEEVETPKDVIGALYLRPFRLDGKIPYSYEAQTTIENAIADFLGDNLPLYGLTAPLDDFGQNTLKDEQAKNDVPPQKDFIGFRDFPIDASTPWTAEVEVALSSCAPIFLVPSTDDGIMWEIKKIIEFGYLEKTIFVMPSTLVNGSFDVKKFWANLQQKFKEDSGIVLPNYCHCGAWFVLGNDLVAEKVVADGAHLKAIHTPGELAKIGKSELSDSSRAYFLESLLLRKADGELIRNLSQWNAWVTGQEDIIAEAKKRKADRDEIVGYLAILKAMQKLNVNLDQINQSADLLRLVHEAANKEAKTISEEEIRNFDLKGFKRKMKQKQRAAEYNTQIDASQNRPESEVTGWTWFGWTVFMIFLLTMCGMQ